MRYCPRCKHKYADERLRYCTEDQSLLSLPDPYRLVGSTAADKYRIDALVGVGGFGAVYAAEQLGLGRRIAFKILKPDMALQHPETVALFAGEARTVAQLTHENIVVIHDSGQADDLAYIAMEWLDGRGLDEELQTQPQLSLERVAEIVGRVAAALAEAHALRILHRDLKPPNVMLARRLDGSERVKVLDFGIAKTLSDNAGSLAIGRLSLVEWRELASSRAAGRLVRQLQS